MNSLNEISEELPRILKAYSEINWLLDNNYPKKSVIDFVGNHNKLTKKARSILYRATHSIDYVKTINRKKIDDGRKLKGKIFHIDLYNQYTSFQSLLNDDPIIICRDGFYRDIFSSIHSKKQLLFDIDSVNRYVTSINELIPSKIFLYIDQQRSNSQKHSHIIDEVLNRNSIDGECIISKSVDHQLKVQNEGVIFSHDSIVLDKSISIFDYLMWYIENRHLNQRLSVHLINFYEIKI